MCLKFCRSVVVFAVLILALPVWARTDSALLSVSQPTTIGTKQLNPGDYQLRAEEGQPQVEVLRDGKVLAQVPCTWIELPAKASNSEVITNNNQVNQVEFEGRTKAITINP